MANSKVHLTLVRRTNKRRPQDVPGGNQTGQKRADLHMTTPRKSSLEFNTEAKEYSIQEFYETFQTCLPLVVMVTQGFYGDICNYCFNRKQIMFINAVSNQKRVVARFESPTGTRLLSIPDTYQEKFCVVPNKDAKEQAGASSVEDEHYLYMILKNRGLPCWVRFPADRTVTAGSRSISTNRIAPFHLIEAFDEINLLGNFVQNGCLYPTKTSSNVTAELSSDVVQIPLYLSKLRLCIVQGIANQPVHVWETFKQELRRLSAQLEYDMQCGNMNIAEYLQKSIHSPEAYPYIQPKCYVNIVSLMVSPPSNIGPIPQGTPNTDNRALGTPNTDNRAQGTPNTDNRTQTETAAPTDAHQCALDDVYEELDETAMAGPNRSKLPDKQTARQQGNTFEQKISLAQDGRRPRGTKSESEYETLKSSGNIPLLPSRKRADTSAETVEILPRSEFAAELNAKITAKRNGMESFGNAENDSSEKPMYTNGIPRSAVEPTRFGQQTSTCENNKTPENERSQAESITKVGLPGNINSSQAVAKLTIQEIGDYLVKLNLGRYVNKFREQQVDGALLVELDREVLQTDFGMAGVEAIRLQKFAKEGHLPV